MTQNVRTNKIWVYSRTPFENSYANVIKFDNKEQQENFFQNSKLIEQIYHADDYSQVKNTGDILVTGAVEKYEKATYMRFQNKGRMYYAFIIGCIYENAEATRLVFEIDVWNTYHIELNTQQFQGYVQSSTLKRKVNNKFNVMNTLQGFNSGMQQSRKILKITDKLEWLVCVLKPSAKFSDGEVNVSFPTTFKSFAYVIVPIDLESGMTYPYIYNGVRCGSVTLKTLMELLTSTFGVGKINTVNQTVNVYTTKHCGVDWEVEDGAIKIKGITEGAIRNLSEPFDINDFDEIDKDIETDNGDGTTTTTETPSISFNESLSYRCYNPHDTTHTLSATNVRKIITYCRQYKMNPMIPISQMYLETHWGAFHSGSENNNWSGITYSKNHEVIAEKYNINLSRGSARPSVEGGYYTKFATFDDFLKFKFMYVYKEGYPKTLGTINFDTAIQGFFGDSTSWGNYADTTPSTYLESLKGIYNSIENNNSGKPDRIIAEVYKNSAWVSSSQQANNKGLTYLKNNLGKALGNGECYAVASAYVHEISTHPYLGAGLYYPKDLKTGADGESAFAIADAYDWNRYGWTVIEKPSGRSFNANDVKIGDILIFKKYWNGSSVYGHVAVCSGKSGNTILYYEQWQGQVMKITKMSDTSNATWDDFTDLIRPPS